MIIIEVDDDYGVTCVWSTTREKVYITRYNGVADTDAEELKTRSFYESGTSLLYATAIHTGARRVIPHDNPSIEKMIGELS